MEIIAFVTMLGAIYAGHYAQRCFHALREVRDDQRRLRARLAGPAPEPPTRPPATAATAARGG